MPWEWDCVKTHTQLYKTASSNHYELQEEQAELQPTIAFLFSFIFLHANNKSRMVGSSVFILVFILKEKRPQRIDFTGGISVTVSPRCTCKVKMCQELFKIWEFFNCITFHSLTTWSLSISLHLPPKSHGHKQDDNCSNFLFIYLFISY